MPRTQLPSSSGQRVSSYSRVSSVGKYPTQNLTHAAALCPPPPPLQSTSGMAPGIRQAPATAYNYCGPLFPTQCAEAWPASQYSNSYTTCSGGKSPALLGKGQRVQGHRQSSMIRSYWNCDKCNVALESQKALEAHCKSHIKCSKCSYTASKKLVKSHFQSAHGKFAGRGFKSVTIAIPGCPIQKFSICVGNHPDDIKQWIQERKKRFPRQRRQSELQDDAKEKRELLHSLLDGYGSSSSEGDDLAKKRKQEDIAISNGGNDSDRRTATRTSSKRRCRYFMAHRSCRNGNSCPFSHEISNQMESFLKQQQKIRSSRSRKSQQSLLDKLLESDARREATLTLQLLRYIDDAYTNGQEG